MIADVTGGGKPKLLPASSLEVGPACSICHGNSASCSRWRDDQRGPIRQWRPPGPSTTISTGTIYFPI